MPPASEPHRPSPDRDVGAPDLPQCYAPPHDLTVCLLADWGTPAIVRARLRDWLRANRWPANRVDELVLAVSEAVSNCVEHGYRTAPDTVNHTGAHTSGSSDPLENLVEVRGQLAVHDDGYSQVVLTVRDSGRWRVPDTRPTTRGRGLALMRGCAEEMDLRHTAHGTTVVLRSRPVPPLPSGT